MNELPKPTKQIIEFYDYLEVSLYLENKHGYKEQDYAGMFSPENKTGDFSETLINTDIPYQNFWHFITNRTEIHNGCFLIMDNDWLNTEIYGHAKEEWQRTIIEYYLSEFGEGDNREINFYVSW